MKTDRELLELAAKAAGYAWSKSMEVERIKIGVLGLWLMPADGSLGNTGWNPLEDDGDALRLAVKLGLLIDVRYTDPVIAQYNCVTYWLTPLKSARIELGDLEPDPLAATRRAIVRAAAELGNQS